MSLIFGHINLQQEPATQASLDFLYEGIAHFPHEKYNHFVKDNMAFGHVLTYNTPEALYEQMPVYRADEQVLFVAQGRIDNRHELGHQLGIKLHSQLPDGELMLRAYLRWGDDCADRLLGDWSLASYDYKTQTLFMARDKMGYTALFYHFDGRRLVFSSSQKSILNLPNFKKELNEDLFIYYLTLWSKKGTPSPEQYYKGIFLLPPAHRFWFKNGQIRTERYWFPENIQPQAGKTPTQYAQELSEIFREAVRCRLRSYRPVAAMLSGGLDSGSVATVAAELYRNEDKRLTTFSHVPLHRQELAKDQKNPRIKQTLDETDNILATARHATNIDPILLNSANMGVIKGAMKIAEVHDGLVHAIGNCYWLYDLPNQVQQQGFGTLLTGEMGNASISFTGVPYLLPITHPAFRHNVRFFLKQKIAKPLILKYAAKWYYKNSDLLDYVQSSYLAASTLNRLGILADIRQQKKTFYELSKTAAEGMLSILMVGHNARCMFGANTSHYFGIEKRDPTGDVRVIEYCLSIPAEAWIGHHGQLKNILKLMMKNRLPDNVLFSAKKGLQSADLGYRLHAEAPQIETLIATLQQHPTVSQYFDLQKMQQHWQHYKTQKNTAVLDIQTFIKNLIFANYISQTNFFNF